MSKIENERATAAKDIHNNRDITREEADCRQFLENHAAPPMLRSLRTRTEDGEEDAPRRLKLSFFVATKAQSVTNK